MNSSLGDPWLLGARSHLHWNRLELIMRRLNKHLWLLAGLAANEDWLAIGSDQLGWLLVDRRTRGPGETRLEREWRNDGLIGRQLNATGSGLNTLTVHHYGLTIGGRACIRCSLKRGSVRFELSGRDYGGGQ